MEDQKATEIRPTRRLYLNGVRRTHARAQPPEYSLVGAGSLSRAAFNCSSSKCNPRMKQPKKTQNRFSSGCVCVSYPINSFLPPLRLLPRVKVENSEILPVKIENAWHSMAPRFQLLQSQASLSY
ncbi:hypothetical protein H6P81_018494 [Aristolochia fimbriata]|uniref:Uncharacterized protein n=1 Tax=Aristolochia fimbriata TaxID=158543 RepID=A0AAV7E189_ARIFI|nr:hypothetical protein H6P81_018494 [Aristolochia fimbriata]